MSSGRMRGLAASEVTHATRQAPMMADSDIGQMKPVGMRRVLPIRCR